MATAFLPAAAQQKKKPVRPYRNVASISPLPLIALEGATYFGVSLEYERFLDKRGRLSTNLALFGGTIGLQDERGDVYAASPGLRYHPMRNTRKLDFSIGIEGIIARQSFEANEFTPTSWNTVVGGMVQLNLDIHVTKQSIIGAHLAVGLHHDGYYYPNSVIEMGLKIGRRF
jgi:hypothetical protein